MLGLQSTCIQEGLSFHCRNTIKCHLLSEMLYLTYTTDICAVRFKSNESSYSQKIYRV